MHYFGDKIDNIKSQINSSKYKDIYLGYQSINYEYIDISQHINMCQGGFIMPYCIKETNIKYANNNLLFSNLAPHLLIDCCQLIFSMFNSTLC